ncbi:hypothetical protein MINS_38260 [Mycolicibacterium insubricum]|nr:hypothetical protein [Mycolicibacterium insubricum]BBZ68397.1 hypothetical protein MINS_38260 [Mycolicibacterium insubricum]
MIGRRWKNRPESAPSPETGAEVEPEIIEVESETLESDESPDVDETVEADDESDESEIDIDDAAQDDDPDPADEEAPEDPSHQDGPPSRRARIVVLGVLPAVIIALAGGAGYLKYENAKYRATETARVEAVDTANDSIAKLLSYQPFAVAEQLASAQDLLTGDFRTIYSKEINDKIIPETQKQKISAEARALASSVISASPNRVTTLLFVNQMYAVGDGPETLVSSRFEVTLDLVGGRWLISDMRRV